MIPYSFDFTPSEEMQWCRERRAELMAARKCSFCGSTNYYTKGFCRKCYERNRRNGTPEYKPKRIKVKPPVPHWTERLTRAVTGQFENPPSDLEGSIYAVLETLTEREKQVILMRYRDRMTLLECGKTFGVTRERISQICKKAERKLRHPSRVCYFLLGLSGIHEKEELKKQEEETLAALIAKQSDKVKESDLPIEYLELSVRSFNSLKRANIISISDLVLYLGPEMDGDKLLELQNLGRKSVEEIVTKMETFLQRAKGCERA